MLRLWLDRLLFGKFFNKIILTFTLIVVVSLSTLTWIITSNIAGILQKSDINVNTHVLNNVSNYFKSKQRAAINISKTLYLQNNNLDNFGVSVLEYMEKGNSLSQWDSVVGKRSLEAYMFSSTFQDMDIKDVLIHVLTDDTWYIYLKSKGYVTTLPEGTINRDMEGSIESYDLHIFPASSPSYLPGNNHVYTMAFKVMNADLTSRIGTMMIDFDADAIAQSYAKYKKEMKGYILIMDDSGHVIFDSSGAYYGKRYPYVQTLLKAGSHDVDLNKEAIVNVDRTSVPGFIIAGIIPKKDIFTSIHRIMRYYYLILIAFIIFSLILNYIGISVFSRRIKTIMYAMKRVRVGDLTYRIPMRGTKDEISEIAGQFNVMCEDLNQYINKVYVLGMQQKNAEIAVLQSQVTPHFLYNTLEAIRMKAVADGNEEVSEMVWILASLFRSTIKSETIIEIQDEIKHCELYLELFKIRYEDKLTVTMDIDRDILSCAIVKHILQPIIENYILHGFDMRRNNHLLIRGYLEQNLITMEIRDNGNGIEPEQLRKLRYEINDYHHHLDSKSSIGLQNVNGRIKLVFGPEYGVELFSEPGKGTTVRLRFPRKTKKELYTNVQSIDR